MNYYVVTLFPEMIQQAASASILGRAAKNGFISVKTVNIRDFSTNKHHRVDDYPYGGGAGMVMEAEPVYQAVRQAEQEAGCRMRVVYLTPQGRVLNQTMVEELAREDHLTLLCGHYEGIDERVLEEVVTDYVSIGDYVLTGGELGAMVMIDAISRFVPGVLSNEESSQFESLQDNLLEYPHYTRPEEWRGHRVPEVLLSGDHKKVEEWRYQQSLERTRIRRPDLLQKSYHITTIWQGEETLGLVAEELTGYLSRYGQVLNYNRNKLRKQARSFDARDLLVFLHAGAPEAVDTEAYRRLCGNATPYVSVYLTEARAQNQGESGQKTVQGKGQTLEEILEKKGCISLGSYEISLPQARQTEEPSDPLAQLALQIRKLYGA